MLPFHAVIQGPLTSPPTPRDNWPPNLNADCVPFILETAAAVREHGGITLVSTWPTADRTQQNRLEAADTIAAVIETADPGKSSDTNGPLCDNRLRQALSTWRGLRELERRGAQGLVAKIRSDQTVPLTLIHSFVENFLANLDEPARNRAVFITGAHTRSLYEIDDFIFVGTIPAVRRFFEAQLRLSAFHSGTGSIHGDLVRKHLFWNVGSLMGLPGWRCFPTIPYELPEVVWPRIHTDIIGPWVRTLLEYLIPMPREVWLQMTWRGSPPFAEWYREDSKRIWFEDRAQMQQEGEDFFLKRWPQVFGAPSPSRLGSSLDYALEVPYEVQRGGANRATVLARRTRRLLNKMRFRKSGR